MLSCTYNLTKKVQKHRIKNQCDNNEYPGGLGSKSFVPYAKGYGLTITLDEAKKARADWISAFPEMELHLNPTEMPGQLVANGERTQYLAETLTGRVRVNCTYASACNTIFQGLASDISKLALWEVRKRNYPMVVFIHDEIMLQLPEDEYLTKRVQHIQHLMEKAMKTLVPDVRVATDAAAMYRWSKKAKGVTDEKGNLVVWEKYLEKQQKRKEV